MDIKKLTGISILFFIFISGCSGKFGKIETQSKSESKITLQELIDNWSDYTIWLKSAAVVFDPKNDNNTLKVSGRWTRVGDGAEKAWIDILRENTQTSDSAFSVWMGATSGFLKVIGPDEQLFGFLVHDPNDLVALRILDRNTMRIYYSPQRIDAP